MGEVVCKARSEIGGELRSSKEDSPTDKLFTQVCSTLKKLENTCYKASGISLLPEKTKSLSWLRILDVFFSLESQSHLVSQRKKYLKQ